MNDQMKFCPRCGKVTRHNVSKDYIACTMCGLDLVRRGPMMKGQPQAKDFDPKLPRWR